MIETNLWFMSIAPVLALRNWCRSVVGRMDKVHIDVVIFLSEEG